MGGKQAKPDLFDVQLEMKMASKQMGKESVRAGNSEKAEKKKVADVTLNLSTFSRQSLRDS